MEAEDDVLVGQRVLDDHRRSTTPHRQPRGPAEQQQVPRAVIEDLIRELEWESPLRWAPVIRRLRAML